MSIYTEHFEIVFGIKQNIQSLRKKVLELAVEGKLVEQDPSDESALELVEKIQIERKRLLESGEINKQKPINPINENEIPFRIPDSWEWMRFGDVAFNYDGKRVPLSKDERIKLNKIYDYYGASGIIDKVDDYIFDRQLLLIGEDGANLIARSKPIAFIAEGKYWVNNHAHVLDFIDGELMGFVKNYINMIDLKPYVTGTAQPKMNQVKMNSIIVPIPPIEEIARINERVESLMKTINELEEVIIKKEHIKDLLPRAVVSAISNCQNEEELKVQLGLVIEHFTEVFQTPESLQELRNVILQLAIQGKLVSQSAADEPTSELLSRIQAEKELLIKEKKTKKEKVLPEIEDAEIPFEIPSSWEWVRLGEIGQIVGGGTPKSNVSEYWADNGIPWVTPADLSNNKNLYVSKGRRDISEKGLLESSATLLPEGTVLFSSRAPIGYTAIAQNNISTNQGFKSIVPYVVAMNQYIYYFMKWDTPRINESATGTTFKEVSGQLVSQLLVPLPPLDEQHRIVRKIVSLFTVIDKLEKEMKRKQLIVKAMATV